MPRLLNALPLIAALSFGAALSAQETTTPETEAEPEAAAEAEAEGAAQETPSEDNGVANDLDMGQDVVEDPTYIKEVYGDWQLKCFRADGQEDLCQMYQLLREEAGNPVAEFSLFKLPENAQAAVGATIVVPLGTLLTENLRLSVDGGPVRSFGFSFCSVVGCFARVGFSQADVDAFKRGAEANIQIVAFQVPDEKIDIKVSLTGFTAALEHVSTVRN